MILVNCGCGDKYNKKWINIDFTSRGGNVIQHNLLTNIPLDSNSVDFLYNSNFLEHLSPMQGERFLLECFRVLKKDGILRIVVPDMENIAREYLEILARIKKGEKNMEKKYEYIMIELLDQMTRMESGGLMSQYWKDKKGDKEYVISRHGNVWDKSATRRIMPRKESIATRIRHCMTSAEKAIFGKFDFYKTYMLGKFALSGERHLWMYDSYGLECILRKIGFEDIQIKEYNVSLLERFAEYKLEVDGSGNEYKPNCLYMEARKA